MSEHMTGADLAHLQELAAAYARAGADIAARAGDLRGRIARSVAAFEATTDRLRGDTYRTVAAIEHEITDLGSISTAVAWTGANRAAFDEELQRFSTSVRAGAAALTEGLDAIRHGGVARFTGLLEEFGVAAVHAGDNVEVRAGDLHRAVSDQSERLHEAASVGWTAA